MTEGQPTRTRCEAHGLVYDPEAHSGCVICRRGTEDSVPPGTELTATRAIKTKLVIAAALLLMVNGVLLAFAVVRFKERLASIEADGPIEPTIDSVVSTLLGTPGSTGHVMLGRQGTNKYGYPRDLPDKLTLVALLRAERFDELTRHMGSFQDAFEADFKKEQWPAIAADAFSIADPSLGPLIDRWVETNPDSFAPYAARAENTMAMAWHYRGSKWAELTSTKRMEKMQEMVALVPVDANRALQLRPRYMPAYALILWSEAAVSASLARKRTIFEMAVRHCPYCVDIRGTYLNFLRPRWGGSLDRVERVAADSQYPDSNPKLRTLLGYADYDRCSALAKKKPKKALVLCNQALEHGPYGAYLLEKAHILDRLERWPEADEALTQALEIFPQNVKYLRLRGWSLLQQERYEEAANDLVLAARIDPTNDNVEKNLLHILRNRVRVAYDAEQQGRLDEAIEIYTSVTRIHPNYVDAWHYRAGAYDKKGEAELAERDCLRAIQIEPTHFESYRFLDYVLFKQKRLDEIVKYWNRYLALKPKDANALLERAGTYHHKGEPELAMRDLDAACSLGNQKACEAKERFQ